MKNSVLTLLVKTILILAAPLFLVSCISNRQVVYLQQDRGKDADTSTYYNSYWDKAYIIKKHDILNIKLKSKHIESNQIISSLIETEQNINGVNASFMYIHGFSVNANGYLHMPLIDSVKASGKTIQELEKDVQKEFLTYFEDIKASIKISGLNVSVLGDVSNPGNYIFYENRISIFDALARAGDLAVTADRKEIKIIRNVGDSIQVGVVDLTSDQALTSDYYYLMPDDIIYAKPLKRSSLGITRSGLSFFLTILGTLSTILLILNYTQQ